MNFEQLDKIADNVWIVFALALLVAVFWVRKNAAWPFVLRTVLGVVVTQQLAKLVQHRKLLGPQSQFPSTHFAVVLALATGFWILGPRFRPVAVVVPVLYGALMLYQHYHTPIEMLGAFYSIPLMLLFLLAGKRKQRSSVA